jgi:hypothetical protein
VFSENGLPEMPILANSKTQRHEKGGEESRRPRSEYDLLSVVIGFISSNRVYQ